MATKEEKDYLLEEISREKELHQQTIVSFDKEREKNKDLISALKETVQQKDVLSEKLDEIQKSLLQTQKKLVDERKTSYSLTNQVSTLETEKIDLQELNDKLTHQLNEAQIFLKEKEDLLSTVLVQDGHQQQEINGDDDIEASNQVYSNSKMLAKLKEFQEQLRESKALADKFKKSNEDLELSNQNLEHEIQVLKLDLTTLNNQYKELEQQQKQSLDKEQEISVLNTDDALSQLQHELSSLRLKLDEEKLNLEIANETIEDLNKQIKTSTPLNISSSNIVDTTTSTSSTSTTTTSSTSTITEKEKNEIFNDLEKSDLLEKIKVLDDQIKSMKSKEEDQLNSLLLVDSSNKQLEQDLAKEKETSIEYQTKFERTTKQLNALRSTLEEELKKNQEEIETLENKLKQFQLLNSENSDTESQKMEEVLKDQLDTSIKYIKELEQHLEKEKLYTKDLLENIDQVEKKNQKLNKN